jgi:hypothetical protein
LLATAACAQDPIGAADGGMDASGESTGPAPTSDPDTGSSGDTGTAGVCPLEGMFVDCVVDGSDGVTYCDEIDGELQWGPCLPAPLCELGAALEGCQRCTLEQGVPTVTGSPSCTCEGPVGLPACEQTECLQRWEYACDDCMEFSSGDCFSYSTGCTSPLLGCDAGEASPCPRVWAQDDGAGGMLDALEDDAAAICLLESLRDGVPGTYEVLWGVMFDDGWVSEQIHVGTEGTVVVEWGYVCPGCFGFGRVGRSGALELQPGAWFDECLAAPTTESLIACTVGLVEYDTGDPPPGYAPPFTTGTCTSLLPTCP